MKIDSARSVATAATVRRPGSPAASGFALAADAPQRAAAAAGPGAVTPLDAILALQAEGFEPERRARQLRRGWTALDALEALVRGLTLGAAPAGLRAELEGLRRAAETTGEAGLDSALLEIDTRLAVELAKLDMAQILSQGRT